MNCVQVCKIVEGQRYSKRLNEKQITNLLKVTCQRPQERELDILEVIHFLFIISYKKNNAAFGFLSYLPNDYWVIPIRSDNCETLLGLPPITV